jgi:hypothetical protein
MRCPTCHTMLITDHRLGIEIDTCPSCDGVWLDRGEFNDILERASDAGTTPSALPGDLDPIVPGIGPDRVPVGRRAAEQSYWMTVLHAD